MRTLWFLVICLSIEVCGLAQSHEALRGCWNSEEVKHAAIGISVKNVADGATVYEYNAGMALRPASVLKLLTTALALKRHGDTLTYQTSVFYTGNIENGTLRGNVVIQAGGDPSLDSKYFKDAVFTDRVVSTLVGLGVKQIEGVIIVEELGDQPSIPGSWPWEDVANYYGALYHPFNYRDNTYTITLSSGKAGTLTLVIAVTPSIPGVKLRNEVLASLKKRDDAWIYGGPEASTLLVKGTIPADHPSFHVKGAMHAPAAAFRAELEKKLKMVGILLHKRKIVSGERQELFTLTSPQLKDIVYYTNKNSVNLFAEALGVLVSTSDYERIVRWELGTMGIDSSGITIKDACGLSPSNALPATVFTDLLVWANKHLSEAFVASLPQGGVDGGLRVYSDDPILKGNLRAKTGSMSGVRALSGYLYTRKGKLLAFTILVNNYTGNSRKVQECVRDFLKELARQ